MNIGKEIKKEELNGHYYVRGEETNIPHAFRASTPTRIIERQGFYLEEGINSKGNVTLYPSKEEAEEVATIYRKTHGGIFNALAFIR